MIIWIWINVLKFKPHDWEIWKIRLKPTLWKTTKKDLSVQTTIQRSFQKEKPPNTDQNKHSINVKHHTILCGVFFVPFWSQKFQCTFQNPKDLV